MDKPIISKNHRLKNFSYIGRYAYFATLCTKDKMPRFKDSFLVKLAEDILRHWLIKEYFTLYAYCFMPDHLHLLVSGERVDSDFRRLIISFKQKSGFTYKQQYKNELWQKSFYDHVLRNDEDLKVVAQYIFENPVRKGIVNDYKDYPFLGSDVFDVGDI